MTLVEILMGMMVSALLVGTAFSTFWVATQSWEKSKRRAQMVRLLDGTADLIARHLRAIQPPFYQGTPAFLAIDDGDEVNDYDTVAFVSAANPRTPPELNVSNLCEVQFHIDTGTNEGSGLATGERATEPADQAVAEPSAVAAGMAGAPAEAQGGLWMRIDPTPDDDLQSGGYLIQLGEQFTSLKFRFFDGTEWVDEWYDDTQVPQAVEFTLTVSDPADRENPMSLIRLVRIPTAKAINEASQAILDQMNGGMQSDSGSDSGQSTGSSGQGGQGGQSGSSGSGGSGGSGGSSYGGGSSGGGGGGGGSGPMSGGGSSRAR